MLTCSFRNWNFYQVLLCIQLRHEATRKDRTALLGLWFSPSVTERSQNEPETRSLRLKALDSALPLPWLCHWSTQLIYLSLSFLTCKMGIILTINSLITYSVSYWVRYYLFSYLLCVEHEVLGKQTGTILDLLDSIIFGLSLGATQRLWRVHLIPFSTCLHLVWRTTAS